MAVHHRDISEEEFTQLQQGKKAFVDGYESDEYDELDVIIFRAWTEEKQKLVSKHKIIQVLSSHNTKAIKNNHVIAFVGEAR
ncbi:hypothetical protein [Vibrio sp. HN007]|uniref:hypothetical protein n=1 Tax=Vibrio iocasae TaxID=3098914 RepID=UPI0035D3E77F